MKPIATLEDLNKVNKPLHVVPSQIDPNWQVHLYDPAVFAHLARPTAHSLSLEAHSSISETEHQYKIANKVSPKLSVKVTVN